MGGLVHWYTLAPEFGAAGGEPQKTVGEEDASTDELVQQ